MYYIGVDLGGTNIAVGIVNEDLKIVDKGSVPTRPERGSDPIVKDMADLCARLLDKNGIALDDVAYVGIASPGIANCADGVVEYSCNLPFRNYCIRDAFRRYLKVRTVYVENDANAAALGEAMAGAAKGTKNSLMITLGTGVGGGIIIDGKVYTGFNFAAGELGHVVLVKGGRLCGCGRRGCFEAYSSATALIKVTDEKLSECRAKGIPTLMTDEVANNGGRINARVAFNAAKKGDAVAQKLVDEYIDYLAEGLTNMINIFQPEILSIGGGISNERDNLLKPLLKHIDRDQYTRDSVRKCRLEIAQLGNDAGIIGAACLGRQNL